jgi:hypothetical protein
MSFLFFSSSPLNETTMIESLDEQTNSSIVMPMS